MWTITSLQHVHPSFCIPFSGVVGKGGGGVGHVLALLLPKIVEKLIIKMFDFQSQQTFHFTTSIVSSSSSEVDCKNGWHVYSNLTIAMLLLLQPHGAEQLAKMPTWKMSQTEISVVNRCSLLGQEKKLIDRTWKVQLLLLPFHLILITSFHVKGLWLSTSVFEKVQLVDLQLVREWWVLSFLWVLC